MRSAKHEDLEYFISAGEEFCKLAPYHFDADSYAETVALLIDDPDTIAIVSGDPARGHSVARLVPSFYDAHEVIARVFTTWGQGGLRCFREVERLAIERGADYLVADSMYEPRIEAFYERRGLRRADALWLKEL